MILIIEDHIQEKIGMFADDLIRSGYKLEYAKTYEEANNTFSNKKNNIEAIILDFAFPFSENNSLEFDEKTKLPNGVKFLCENEFSLFLKQIPIIINTSCENGLRKQLLERLQYLPQEGLIIFQSDQMQNLANSNFILRKDIIASIKKLKRPKKSHESSQGRIFEKGTSGVRDEEGHFTYRENGG